MKQGRRITRTEQATAFNAYIESGSLNRAAAAISAHPKTLQKIARKAGWQKRRAAILAGAAEKADAEIMERLATSDAAAKATWKTLLKDQFTRRAVLELIAALRPK
jgi:hypothetical protein